MGVKSGQKLDPNSPLPLHHQLRETLRYELLNGDLVDANGKIPTEAEICKHYGVSRITVRNAIQSLVDEGLLTRERGRGTFLRSNKVVSWIGQLMGFAEAIEKAGFKPGSEVISHGLTTTFPRRVKNNLRIDTIWELKRLRFANEQAIAIEHNYHPPEIGLELAKQNLQSVLIYKFIEETLGIILSEGDQYISAVNAGEEEARILGVMPGQALLQIERVSYSLDQKPVEYLRAIYRPDYFQYSVKLSRNRPVK